MSVYHDNPYYDKIIDLILDWAGYVEPDDIDPKCNQILHLLWGDDYDKNWHKIWNPDEEDEDEF